MLNKPGSHFIFVFIIVVMSAAFFQFAEHETIYQENHFMENLQAAILVAAAIAFFIVGFKLETTARYVAWFLAALSWAFFIREIEIEDLGFPSWVEFLFAGKGRALFAIPFLVSFCYLGKHYLHYLQHIPSYLSSTMGIYLIIAGVCMAAGWPMDRKIIDFENVVFWEECFELAGYCFVLVAALHAPSSLRAIQAKGQN